MKYCGVWALLLVVLTGCGGDGKTTVFATTGDGTVAAGNSGGPGGPNPGGIGLPDGAFSFDTGLGGSGGILGDVQGFGSVIVNDLEMATDDADFFVEGEPASESDLRVGHYVVVTGDLGSLQADEVHYRSNLKGPVSAPPVVVDPLTGRYELTVLGQTVVTTASTRFDGVLAANIAEGGLLEVSGPIDADGRVIATYIELQDALAEYKAIGMVAGLDSGAMTFELGGLAVDYANAALSEFEGAALANGQLVEVRMPAANFTAPTSAEVTEVERLPVPVIEEGAEVEVQGFIDQFASATDFTVSGVRITTDGGTQYEHGTAGMLAPNVKVEVKGVANASGVIVAEQIEFKSDEAVRVQGEVTNVVTADGITGSVETELGVAFEIRASTELEDESSGSSGTFTLSDLTLGDYVEVRGFVEGGEIVAVELQRDDPRTRALLRGSLTAFDKASSTVEIQNVSVSELDGTTEYEDETESPLDRDAFYDLLQTRGLGTSVKAEWDDFSSLALPADKLSLEDDG
jgi:hypothetical protein